MLAFTVRVILGIVDGFFWRYSPSDGSKHLRVGLGSTALGNLLSLSVVVESVRGTDIDIGTVFLIENRDCAR